MNILRRKWNWTIRVRLTVLYGGAFFLAGSILIGILYFQLSQVVGQQLIIRKISLPAAGTGEPLPLTNFQLKVLPPNQQAPMEPRRPLPAMRGLAEAQAQMQAARAAVLKRVLVVSILSLVGVGVLATALGWLLAGQVLRPLRQITTTVRGIADRNLHQRIAMAGPQDEIKDLSDTLDDMLARLDRAFDSQQRFIANASHELRTPLAINRTLVEVAMLKEGGEESPLHQLGTTLLAVNQRHEHLIDGLLMLASSEQEIANPEDVELAGVARHVLMESAAMAQAAGVKVQSRIEAALCRGDAVLLERLIQNLVDNAIRYNLPADGWLRVATTTDAQGRACITVENPGPVIADHEVPRLFEPFRRLASTERITDGSSRLGRRGAGLGLSIVRAIVTSHGGVVQATPRQDGGLVVHVVLPAHKA